jgi:aryl-alcohol dehydrogenase-like predicted oxidoreductase
VREACSESLRRLQTTYLDLVIFEWNDQLLPLRGTLDAFNSIVRRGLVRFIGAANFPAWRVAETLGRAFLGNHARMEVLQADYSLMTRARFEPEVMALCQEQRLGFLARSPLAGGFLARGGGAEAVTNSLRRDWLAERFGNRYGEAALAAVSAVAGRNGASMAQVALAWVLGNPQVTSTVIGVRTPAQLRELAEACALRLAGTDLHALGEATALEEVRVSAGTRPAAAEAMAAV